MVSYELMELLTSHQLAVDRVSPLYRDVTMKDLGTTLDDDVLECVAIDGTKDESLVLVLKEKGLLEVVCVTHRRDSSSNLTARSHQ
tara:strand:- start:1588 stop:1845 length:258 start_codon:yes stop_codon:yes gene_type:complete